MAEIPEDLGKKFMRIEFYVTSKNGQQIITLEPARFPPSSEPLEEYAKMCAHAIQERMDQRSEEERIPLRMVLDEFLKGE